MASGSIYDRGDLKSKTIYGNGTRDTDTIVEGEVMDSYRGEGMGKTPEERQTSPEERVEEFLRQEG